MNQAITISVLVAGAVFAALAAVLGMAGAVHVTSRRPHGYFHLVFYAILFTVALPGLLSDRDLTSNFLSLEDPGLLPRHPLMVLAQPLVSLLMMTVAGERIFAHWLKRDKTTHSPQVLLITFIVFWLGTVAAPALFGAHPQVSHDFVYPLIIAIAAVLATGVERDLAFAATRNALVLLMSAGLLLVPFNPGMVLDSSYMQGLLPGVPRFAGLAAHAVSMGTLAQLALICLLAIPFERAWLNRLAWLVSLTVLFLAQSKTAWLAFAICSACIITVRSGPSFWRRVGDPMRPEFGILAVLIFIAALLAFGSLLTFGEIGARLSSFFGSAQGAQFASLTGRDQIWAIAYDEWERNPVFGYGPGLWDASFRASIGMANATHAHNQFMDTLSRSGTVGALALVFYALVLLTLSVRYARATGGVTLALFLALALRCVSEVPLSLFGYGAELITQVLLLMALASAAGQTVKRNTQAALTPAHAAYARKAESRVTAGSRP